LCSKLPIQINHTNLQKCEITDHDLLLATLPMSPAGAHPTVRTASKAQSLDDDAGKQNASTYRWAEGTCLKEYGTSAVKWKHHSTTPEFEAKFREILQKTDTNNDIRSSQIEAFLIQEAKAAGVLNETVRRTSTNPNKWEKHLAPWFNARCRDARARYRAAMRHNGKAHAHTQHALKRYVQACKDGRAQMQFDLPDMLKQRPKQFWGMLKNKERDKTDLSIQAFKKFNESIFYDENIPPDVFTPLTDASRNYIT
jgi:hypothetical protein